MFQFQFIGNFGIINAFGHLQIVTVKYGLDKHIQNIHVITFTHTNIHKCKMHSRNNYKILSRVLFIEVLASPTNLAMFIKV